jgi:predicted dehydrogenase
VELVLGGMKALVVGYGSIGQRHVRLLLGLGCSVAVVSRRLIEYSPTYPNLTQALETWRPDYVVIASCTSEHHEDLSNLAQHGFCGLVMVEKPLFNFNIPILENKFSKLVVAYNLRFHPLLQRLKAIVDQPSRLITAHIYVGSYLPNWRANTDYRQSYSAQRMAGGGVLRDLSHELDYALWLFGSWQRLTANGGKFSALEIDSDDTYSILMETPSCSSVAIHLNYLDRVPRRQILLNTEEQTISVDLYSNSISLNGVPESIALDQDFTYRSEHQAMLSGQFELLCSAEAAQETLRMIEAAEQAARLHTWIEQ